MARKRSLGAGALLLAILAGLAAVTYHHRLSAQVDELHAPALWVGGTTGIAKSSVPEGSALLQIRDCRHVRELAVDEWNQKLWAYADGTLLAYGFDGARLLSLPVRPPGRAAPEFQCPDEDDARIAMAIDPSDGALWVAKEQWLYLFDTHGARLLALDTGQAIRALALEPGSSRVWVALSHRVIAFERSGARACLIDLGRRGKAVDLAYDAASSELVVGLKESLRRYDGSGAMISEVRLDDCERIAPDGKGGLWLVRKRGLSRLDHSGRALLTIDPFPGRGKDPVSDLAADPSDGSLWLASPKSLAHVSQEGRLLAVSEPEPLGRGRVLALSLYRGTAPPKIEIVSPRQDELITSTKPAIEISWSGQAVEPSTLALRVNGVDVAPSCTLRDDGAGCTLTDPLPEGANRIGASIKNTSGLSSGWVEASFTVDSIPPEIVISSPSDGLITNKPVQIIAGRLTEPSALLSIGSVPITVGQDGSFTHEVSLSSGLNLFGLRAVDRAGNASELILKIALDITPPVITITSPQDGLTTREPTQIVEGYLSEEAALTIASLPATLGPGLQFSGSVILAEGESTVLLAATDRAGNRAEATLRIKLDSTAPEILLVSPADGALTKEPLQPVAGRLTENGSLSLNGTPVPLSDNLEFVTALTLEEGPNALHLEATDEVGNTRKLTVTVSLDTAPPFPVDFSCLSVVELSEVRVRVSVGSRCAEPGSVAWITNLETGEAISTAVGADGSLAAEIDARSGDTLAIRLVDGAGNMGAAVHIRALFEIPAPAAQIPEGSFGYSYRDLVPEDATIASYAPNRFSLITGLVLDEAGAPLPGVVAGIHGHPEYGTATTDREGRFSLPVEGGGLVTLVFEHPERLGSQRKVSLPWNEIRAVEAVTMLRPDQASSLIELDGDPQTVLTHQASRVSDASGARSASLVFTGDNRAWSADADGNRLSELRSLTVRATEYATPESMPAELPPASAYTYCVELSADEAQRVVFEKPVILWVDNFLNFPVAETVPVGYFDRDKSTWIPSDSGLVVRLLDRDGDGSVDAIDADGDSMADDLNADGSFADEAAGLSDPQRYPPGSLFWRVDITHFTPWDCNWGYSPPDDAVFPNPSGLPEVNRQPPRQRGCMRATSSFVEERSRVFHEDIAIPGTGLSLHYASNRVKGHWHSIAAPVSGPVVPASLKQIIARVEVAGRSFVNFLSPLPNQKVTVEWNRLDTWGRQTRGSVTALVRIGFVYEGSYLTTGRFGYNGNGLGTITGGLTRGQVVLWKESQILVGGVPVGASGMGADFGEGWTLSSHHRLDPAEPTLCKGDGMVLEQANAESKSRSLFYSSRIDTVAGGGQGDDGGPAVEARLGGPRGLCFAPDGSLFIADGCRVRKVSPDGLISTVVGTGSCDFLGDNGPATQAALSSPSDVALDSFGNLYISDSGNQRIRKVDQAGRITTVAGEGPCLLQDYYGGYYYDGCYGGDDGPALSARLNHPSAITVGTDGSLFIADGYNRRVRKVDPEGIITTVAGTGYYRFEGEGGPASRASLSPEDVFADGAGNLFIADSTNRRIYKVDQKGIITTVAGGGSEEGDGGSATQARLSGPSGVAADSEGNLFIAELYGGLIRGVNSEGIITTVAGSTSSYSSTGDHGPAREFRLSGPCRVALGPDGSLCFTEAYARRIRKLGAFSPFVRVQKTGERAYADQNGLGYVFSSSGLHEKTVDLDSGALVLSLSHDDQGRLLSISDRLGNTTAITRGSSGAPTEIVSPDGLVSRLTVDANNHLTRIVYPDGGATSFDYDAGGLMEVKTEPAGNRFEHRFTPAGGLAEVADEEGGHWIYSRYQAENGKIYAWSLGAEGSLTLYLDQKSRSGLYTSTITDPTGGTTLYTRSADELRATKSLPCGMQLDLQYGMDPQYSFAYLKKMVEATPSGLQKISEWDRAYEDTDLDGTADVITHSFSLNGRKTTIAHEIPTSTRIVTSPMGKRVSFHYDPQALLTTSREASGLHPVSYGYDARGRLSSVAMGERHTAFAYNETGSLSSLTDPEERTTSFGYDPVGRVTELVRPDGSSLHFAYDPNGSMTVLTTPSAIEHRLGYNRVNLGSSYTAPLSGSYAYIYDKERRLSAIRFPSGKEITNTYSKAQLVGTHTPESDIGLTYHCSGSVESISSGAETISYGYDGSLLKSETLSGTLSRSLTYTYDLDFRPITFSYADGSNGYAYDSDGLMTRSGIFTISRSSSTGLPEAVSGGSLSLSRTFNGYGETISEAVQVNGTDTHSWTLARSSTGRITGKTEATGGLTTGYAYTYDALGRLLTVERDGTAVEEYEYGPSGERTQERNALRGIASRSFTYSEEDHLLTAGDTAYEYDLDGFLTTRTRGSEVTGYSYSARGELLGVTLPDGRLIEYVHDPLGRRIARKVDGSIREKYLWQGMTRLLAVYDANEHLLMRFQYADSRMPAAMTRGSETYYLAYDQVGSLRIVTDSTGGVVKEIDYDSFGNILSDTNPAFVLPFGFAGGLLDPDTGLVRFGFRDYDPDVGRWTAKDPLLFDGGDTNLFGYAQNDPVNLIDPDGRFWVQAAGVVFVVGAFVYYGWQTFDHLRDAAKDIDKAREADERLSNACMIGDVRGMESANEDRMNAIQNGLQSLEQAGVTAGQLPGTIGGGPLGDPLPYDAFR